MRGRSYEQRSSSYKRKVLFDSRLVTPIQISDLHPPGKLRRDRRGAILALGRSRSACCFRVNGRVDADYSCDLTRVPHICWACRTQVRWSLEFLADTRRIYLVRVQLVDT